MRSRPSNLVLLTVIGALVVAAGTLWALSAPPTEAPPLRGAEDVLPRSDALASRSPGPRDVSRDPAPADRDTQAHEPPPEPPVPVPPPTRQPADDRPPPTPAAQARQARLQEPDAVWYGAAASSWRAIQRELVRSQAPPAVLAGVADLVEDLRASRRDPDRVRLAAKQRLHRHTMRRVRDSDPPREVIALLDTLEQHDAQLTRDLSDPY